MAKKNFLDLPGEIQNLVYHFASEVDTIDLFRDAEYLSAERQRKHMRKIAGLEKEPRLPTERQFLSLTQVCRQLQAEYRPTCMTETKVQVEYHDHFNIVRRFETWVEKMELPYVTAEGGLMGVEFEIDDDCAEEQKKDF